MAERLNSIVKFRGDRLFNGAVNVSWATTNYQKAKMASESFVFHGPKYHGIRQEEVGAGHGHKLIDTASFALRIAQRCYGVDDNPFTLAIAGYGTGKSHLALTLATLLGSPNSETSQKILHGLKMADSAIAGELDLILKETSQPCLAITINGMQGVDLSAEICRQITALLLKDGHDTKPLADLRPRFAQAANLTRVCNDNMKNALLATVGLNTLEEVVSSLEGQDERIYAKVHDFFAASGLPITAIRGESIKDIIDTTAREYCGTNKPYRALLILFDEFGKYTEFATVKSQIAGNGVLQDLFEAVQSNSAKASFVGFIQFELNAYVQRVAPELRNEILRYVTRFQNVSKLYLSINLETLIASLLEKVQPERLQQSLRDPLAVKASMRFLENIGKWFPHAKNYRVWSEKELFHQVIREGCWPLSPYSTWFLFYLAAAGKHLQERSALAILGEAIQRYEGKTVFEIGNWAIAPADLWSDVLQQEFITSEETGHQGSIAQALASVVAKHGSKFSPYQINILRAIVIASKLGLVVSDKIEGIQAIAELAGLAEETANNEIKQLQEDFNIIEWDNAFKAFDILGDAVPRAQFISFLRQRVGSAYDEAGKAMLFVTKGQEWFGESFGVFDSDFADENRITTQEWRFRSVLSTSLVLPQNIKMAIDYWADAVEVDKPRGTIIFTYLGPSEDPEEVKKKNLSVMKKLIAEAGFSDAPIVIVFMNDENGDLGKNLAEFSVLDSLTDSDRNKFGNLVSSHKEKLTITIQEQIDTLIKSRNRIIGLKTELEALRLQQLCTEVFSKIYKSPITFPFDGFNVAKGNAAETCFELTRELLLGKLDYQGILSKQPKVKNRAKLVLDDSWKIFNKSGYISRRPEHPCLNTLTANWDDELNKNGKLILADMVKQLCLPPYGANIASAGLIVGVYVAPRHEKIAVVKGLVETSFQQWLQEDLFKSKFLNLPALQSAFIVPQGEGSSEWDLLLDEWEHAASHSARLECYRRAQDLKLRLPFPQAQIYREEALRNKAEESEKALKAFNKEFTEALTKAEYGITKRDVSHLALGVFRLKQLKDKMVNEGLWLETQIQEIVPHIEIGRQNIIQFFPDWLPMQTPINDSPDEAGTFKHLMLKQVGKNLKELNLEEEHEKLEAHTNAVIKNIVNISEARQLIHTVNNWLVQHVNVTRLPKILEIRRLFQASKDYVLKLKGLAQRVQMPEITEVRKKLAEFAKLLRDCEEDLVERSSKILDLKISSESDIESATIQIEALISAFEGLSDDLEDLNLMKKMLRLYRSFNHRLSDKNLSWDAFEKLSEDCIQEGHTLLGENEIPWSPEDMVEIFVKLNSKERKEKSQAWLDELEKYSSELDAMDASQANRFLNRLNTPPAFVTESHQKVAKKIAQMVTKKLTSLEMEWLIEKFKELPAKSQKEFLATVKSLISS